MKKQYLIIPLAAFAVAASSSLSFAAPGKASDSIKEPAAKPEATLPAGAATKSPDKEPGKTSDSVKENAGATENKFSGKVTAVDADKKTVTIEQKKGGSHVLQIAEGTKVMKGKATGAFTDIKVGEMVHGTCKKVGDGAEAEMLHVGK